MENSRQIYSIIHSVEDINRKFNEELKKHVEGTLPKGHIYKLGFPCDILKSTGFPNLPIELSSTRLEEKSKQRNHQFDIIDVLDLVNALQRPVGVFSYGDKFKSQNVIIDLQRDYKNFVVGVFFYQLRAEIKVLSIRGLFNKHTPEWLNWITQGKALYLDKKKIQILIDQQRTNLADVEYLDLNLIESIIKAFINPL